jgi:hypothetical protein
VKTVRPCELSLLLDIGLRRMLLNDALDLLCGLHVGCVRLLRDASAGLVRLADSLLVCLQLLLVRAERRAQVANDLLHWSGARAAVRVVRLHD